MKLRVISPFETIVKYALTELFGVAFFCSCYEISRPIRFFP